MTKDISVRLPLGQLGCLADGGMTKRAAPNALIPNSNARRSYVQGSDQRVADPLSRATWT